jgi:hypothetical protein
MAKILSQAAPCPEPNEFSGSLQYMRSANDRHISTHCEPQWRTAHHPLWGFDCALWLFGCDV